MCQLSFCEIRNRNHNAKGKIVQCYKDQSSLDRFWEFTVIPNEELYGQVCCCILNEKCFFVEWHVATRKHQKGIETRNFCLVI